MASITTRAGKSSPLTHNEVDANFNNLNADKLDAAGIALGSAANPTIKFTGDTNTGIYSPGADQLAISTNGTGRLFVDASGRVGVGTSSPQAPLHVIGTEGLRVESAASSEGFIRFVNTSGSISIGMGGAVGNNLLIYDRTNNQTVYNYAAGVSGSHIWSVNNTERMRLDSSGRLGLGTSSPGTLLEVVSSTDDDHLTLYKTGVVGGAGPGIKFSNQNNSGTRVHLAGIRNEITSGTVGAEGGALVFTTKDNGDASPQERLYISSAGNVGIGTTSPGSALEINAAAATSPFIAKINTSEVARIDSSGRLLVGTSSSSAPTSAVFQGNSNSASGSSLVYLQSGSAASSISSGTEVGRLRFADNAGGLYAEIMAVADAAGGTNDYPGRLVFSVTADGASSPTEALRISNDRSITVSDGGNVVLGTTTGTKIGTGTTQKLGFYNATPVVQPTAVADATDAATVITQLNALLTRMRNLGLIAT